MKTLNLIFILSTSLTLITTTGCKKKGCTDSFAANYDSSAGKDDGSCEYIHGCTNSTAANYNPQAGMSDGSCEYYGEIIFWQRTGSGFGITTVTLNNEYKDITTDYSLAPYCNATGCATFRVNGGTTSRLYSYGASDGTTTWSGNVAVYPNQCVSVELD